MTTSDDHDSATTQRWLRRRSLRPRDSEVGKMFGRYRVIGVLGSGGMGRVLKAVDTRDGQVVALKVLFETDAKGLARITREFRRMADISHPNLVALYELGDAGSQRFLVMEFVAGRVFVAALRPGGVLAPPERLRDAVRGLTLGVHALHMRGRVHRDLKPPNVMVSDQGRVVILDFGLVDEIHRKTLQTSSLGLEGTPPYMAPELAAGQLATPASDWYAVGVMLFEAVTGKLPFTGSTSQQMLDKQRLDPPLPSLLAPGIDPVLDRLIHGLLAREPGHRLAAQDLLAWCDERVRVASVRIVPTLAPHELVGLDAQQRILADAFRQVLERRLTVMVDVFGPSGTGKTALVHSFLAGLRREGTLVLAGRCFAQETVDFKALDGVIDALAKHLRRLPAADVESLLDDSFAALAHIFPVLSRVQADRDGEKDMDAVFGVEAVQREVLRRLNLGPTDAADQCEANRSAGRRHAPTDTTDGTESRTRGFRGLKLLLYRLALRAPLVLVIDDLQWGDTDSAHLLADLLEGPSSPPLLFIGIWRSEDTGRSPLLRTLEARRGLTRSSGRVVRVETGPLDADEAMGLALQRLRRDDGPARATARTIARESGGNPMLIDALARDAVLEHPLAERTGSLEQLVQRRLGALSPEACRLLELIAVAGQPIAQDVLGRIEGLEGDRRPALGQLRAERLIRTDTRDPDSVEIYHDRIRVAVVHGISRHRLATHHHTLAEALLAGGSDDLERIARHLFAAGERERAAEYAADAAHAAERTLAFERAATLYRLASVCRPHDWVLKRRMADALVRAGRTGEAGPLYLVAAEQASAAAAARLQGAAVESLLVAGQLEAGLTILRPLLAAIGAAYPEPPAQASAQLAAQLDELVARGVGYVEKSVPQIASRELAVIDTCMCAARGLVIADPVRGGFYAVRAASLALDVGEPRRIIRGLALASTIAAPRQPAAAQLWLQAAERIATQIKDQEAYGIVDVHAGVIHRLRGAWHDAYEALTHGLYQLDERGQSSTWERSFAATSLLTTLEALGELRRLAAEAGRFARQAEESGNRHMAVMAALYGALARLSEGDIAATRDPLRPLLDGWPGETLELYRLHTLKIQVDGDLYAGEAARAWQRVLNAWPTIEQAGFSRVPIRRLEALQIRARAAVASLALQPDDAQLRQIAATDLEQIGREPLLHARPLEALLRAGLDALAGEREALIMRLRGAIHGFDSVGMSLHSTVARRGLGLWTPGNDGVGLVQQAELFMRMQDVAEPPRWAAMIAPGLELPREQSVR